MTNWMTAAGLAFIAGGIATLISFRAVLFGGGARRATRAGAAPRRRRAKATGYPVGAAEALPGPRIAREPESAMFPSTEFDRVEPEPRPEPEPEPEPVLVPAAADEPELEEPVRETRAGRRRRLAAAFSGRPAETPEPEPEYGLAEIGLADDEPELAYEDHEPEEDDDRDPEYDDDRGYDDPFVDSAEHPPAADPWAIRDVDRSDQSYGDRVDGWVRPRYRDLDDRLPAGDYWTPVPDAHFPEHDPEPSARGYGWPVPVERLPPVPDYEPATGFDLTPVQAAEPTLVAAWGTDDEAARRIRLPRSWQRRDERPAPGRFASDPEPAPVASPDDATEIRSRHGRAERTRTRPRPRPRPGDRHDPGGAYVSRHSAGPHA